MNHSGWQALLAFILLSEMQQGAQNLSQYGQLYRFWQGWQAVEMINRNGYQSENIRKPGKTVRILVRSFFFVGSLVFYGP